MSDDAPTIGIVQLALGLARIAHRGQLDKADEPYMAHVERVANKVESWGWSAQTIALLHDVVEDSPFTTEDLRDLGFPQRITESVEALTRRPEENPDEYYARILGSSTWAVAVKLADVRDNADPRRLVKLSDEDQLRLLRKYAHALDALEGLDF